jgi:hypothetical protein
MTRGRLVFKFVAELHRLDTQAIEAARAYDHDFKESVLVEGDDGVGERVRMEHAAVRLPCQVEPETFDALRMSAAGNSPASRLALLFHFVDLEREGLVDLVSGDALVRPGDRLGALYDGAGELVQFIRTPPGLYVIEARPIGFGLNRSRPRRNLLLVTFGDRPVAAGRHP